MKDRADHDWGMPCGDDAVPAGSRSAPALPSLDSLVREFWLIEDALGDCRNVIRLPGRLFLEDLPPEFRGPHWKPGRFPDVVIEVDPWDLLCKMRSGRVAYPLARIVDDMPAGWIEGLPDAEIVLDPGKVSAALREWPWLMTT